MILIAVFAAVITVAVIFSILFVGNALADIVKVVFTVVAKGVSDAVKVVFTNIVKVNADTIKVFVGDAVKVFFADAVKVVIVAIKINVIVALANAATVCRIIRTIIFHGAVPFSLLILFFAAAATSSLLLPPPTSFSTLLLPCLADPTSAGAHSGKDQVEHNPGEDPQSSREAEFIEGEGEERGEDEPPNVAAGVPDKEVCFYGVLRLENISPR